jgi:hypothetical protein
MDEWFHAVRAMAEKGFIPVPRKMVNGVTADIASVQMIIGRELLIQIQLFVDELQQPIKIACAHSTSCRPVTLRSLQSSHTSQRPSQ